jgi:hypothetical protein
MSETLQATIVDASTGEIIVRDLTTDEIADLEAQDKESKAEAKAKTEAKKSALSKLAALGLTQEEIEAL